MILLSNNYNHVRNLKWNLQKVQKNYLSLLLNQQKKIVTATEATQQALATLPADIADRIQAAQPQPQAPQPAPKRPRTNIIDKFTPEGIAAIKDPNQILDIAAYGYYEREKYVKPDYVKSLKHDHWIKDVYRIFAGIPKIGSSKETDDFNEFGMAVNKYVEEAEQGKRLSPPQFELSPPQFELPQQSKLSSPQRSQQLQQREQERQEIIEQQQQQELKLFEQSRSHYPRSTKSRIPVLSPTPKKTTPPKPSEEEEEEFEDTPGATGTGLGSGLITCPNNVLADVERLEILIGGKRAGNNSSEIINEAADICKRLFSGGIMDIDVYRSLINEIADDYHSD